MKRLIYSIFGKVTEDHKSASPEKYVAFQDHYTKLEHMRKRYAQQVGAEYVLFERDDNYVDMQFYKIYKMQELVNDYDEVLYLDFDVIPNTTQNFFEVHDFSKICCTTFTRAQWENTKTAQENFRYNMKHGGLDNMNLYVKGALKISMLMLDGIYDSKNAVINTGVIGASKNSMIDFKSELPVMMKKYKEAMEDSLYPEEITSLFTENNEVFFTYLLERDKIGWHDIGLPWNYILDHRIRDYTPSAHFIHQVNKDFRSTFDAL
jgi:hypothetical protein